MERIRINRRDVSLRARQRAACDADITPLVYASGGATGVDEDLLARIDALLAEGAAPAPTSPEDRPTG